MSSPECDELLLDSLYTASGEPEAWQHFLALVASRLGANCTGLIFHKAASQQYLITENFGVDPDSLKLYRQYYGVLDPWYLAIKSQQVAEWVGRGTALWPPGEFEKTEYYNDSFKLGTDPVFINAE